MPKKEKVISLFEGMIRKAANQEMKEDSDTPVSVGGKGHVVVTGKGNTINVYNQAKSDS